MNTGIKILIVLIIIFIVDLIATIALMAQFPTWNPLMVFGIGYLALVVIVCYFINS